MRGTSRVTAAGAIVISLLATGGPAAAPARAATAPAAVSHAAPRHAWSFPGKAGGDPKRGIEVAATTDDAITTIVEADGPGGRPRVSVRSASGVVTTTFEPYPSGFRGGSTVAVCTLDKDGTKGIVTGAGPGGGPHVRLFTMGGEARDGGGFFAYDPRFASGIFVACADLDGDGVDEVVTGPGAGGGPNVRVFSLAGQLKASFFAEDTRFVGGIRVAGLPATVDRPGRVVTAAGRGGGPAVRTFTPVGANVDGVFCFDPAYNGGVTVAAGDVDRDGTPDVVCGSASGTSNVAFLTDRLARSPKLDALFVHPAGGTTTSDGVRVAVAPGAGTLSLIAASAPGSAGGASVEVLVGTPPGTVDPQDLIAAVAYFGDTKYYSRNGEARSLRPGFVMGIREDAAKRSPNRARVVGFASFAEDPAAEPVLVTAEADGADVRRVAGTVTPSSTSWAGSDLVMVDAGGLPTVMSPDGTNRRRAAGTSGMTFQGLSPDGTQGLFLKGSTPYRWSTAVNGQQVVALPDLAVAPVAARLANDGSIVTCSAGNDVRLRPAGGTERLVTHIDDCSALALSPDGTRIAAVRAISDGLVVAVRLSDGHVTEYERSTCCQVFAFKGWAPDSSGFLASYSTNQAYTYAMLYRVDGTKSDIGGAKYGFGVAW